MAYSATRMGLRSIPVSYWQFDPDPGPDDEGVEVEAMDSRVRVTDSGDGNVMLVVRGKPTARYEKGDSVWLEFTANQAIGLMGQIAEALVADHDSV